MSAELSTYRGNVYSQNGEDGIIRELLRRLNMGYRLVAHSGNMIFVRRGLVPLVYRGEGEGEKGGGEREKVPSELWDDRWWRRQRSREAGSGGHGEGAKVL